MKFLLDTNVFREIGKTKPHANVAVWLEGVDDIELAISALSVREVRKGIDRLRLSNARLKPMRLMPGRPMPLTPSVSGSFL